MSSWILLALTAVASATTEQIPRRLPDGPQAPPAPRPAEPAPLSPAPQLQAPAPQAPTRPPTAARSADVVLLWNDLVLQAVRTARTPPPLAARNMALVHGAIFDAVNAIEPTYTSFLVPVQATPGASPEVAAAAAAHRVLLALYPLQRQVFDDALTAAVAEAKDDCARDGGLSLGRFVAERFLEWRQSDEACLKGQHVVRQGVGKWQPTPPAFREALLPLWNRAAPLALRHHCLPRLPGPPPLTSAAYTAAFREVKTLGARHGSSRTPEQTAIAFFWVDGEGTSTPAGHWNRIAQDVTRTRGTSLVENARLFALLNFALADAGIVCWMIKFEEDFWRPVTAIHRAEEDGNPDTDPDPAWEPLVPTPPFPSYTSGHSTFSGAAARILAHAFGADDLPFQTASEGLPGVKRSFSSFSAAAAEAGRSRIYGGIHYEFDNADGLANGRAIADYIHRHYLRPTEYRTARPFLPDPASR